MLNLPGLLIISWAEGDFNANVSPTLVKFKVDILDFLICMVLLPNDSLLFEMKISSVNELDAIVAILLGRGIVDSLGAIETVLEILE